MRLLPALLTLAACAMSPEGGHAASEPQGLDALADNRTRIAADLAGVAAKCVIREDTRNAAFHGCIDWHSAVHGIWALVAYEAATGDSRHAGTVSSILTPENLSLERRLLIERPRFEMPYGRAWLLRLAIERGRLRHDPELLALADVAAASLLEHYSRSTPDFYDPAYGNASWALGNLLDYYDFRRDSRSASAVRKLLETGLLKEEAICSPASQRSDFMSVCFAAAWAISRAVSRSDFTSWSRGHVPPSTLPAPVTEARTAHEQGLNFSRSWGLWALFSSTGDKRYAEAYADHFMATYGDRDNFAGDYGSVGHWVAQFGMFALQPLFSRRPGRPTTE